VLGPAVVGDSLDGAELLEVEHSVVLGLDGNHPNYFYIRKRYEELMLKFEKRLDNIANQKNVSLEVLDGLA
ncbi:MAG TPA: hypothetical protein H9966_00440, partial [Candidatus Prevotella avicola]|nr:hypothetical protein [Candidatus Prevotella avicola]